MNNDLITLAQMANVKMAIIKKIRELEKDLMEDTQ